MGEKARWMPILNPNVHVEKVQNVKIFKKFIILRILSKSI